MTRKKFIKKLMATGMQRNEAIDLAWKVQETGVSYQEVAEIAEEKGSVYYALPVAQVIGGMRRVTRSMVRIIRCLSGNMENLWKAIKDSLPELTEGGGCGE